MSVFDKTGIIQIWNSLEISTLQCNHIILCGDLEFRGLNCPYPDCGVPITNISRIVLSSHTTEDIINDLRNFHN